ncbi:MATE family efflux transporter [Lacibacterium aquatile]|uniref:Multidrug-efflux transporter n=1 Tax=Lacibacterium aquatile TaxID=1168082 RepID=A0ABW5DQX4_9PROT
MSAPSISQTPIPSGHRGLIAEIALLLRFAAPVALSQLLIMGMHVSDTIILGRLGADALAAAALTGSIFIFVLIFGLGLMMAIAPLASQAHGAGDLNEAGVLLRQITLLALLTGFILAIILGPSETYLLWLGQDPKLAADTATYLGSLRWSLPAVMVLVAGRNFLSAIGRPGMGLVFVSFDFCVNIVLALTFVLGWFGFPAMGLFGAGLATAVTATTGSILMMATIATAPSLKPYWQAGGSWLPDFKRQRQLLTLGLPIGITMVMEVGLFAISTLLMGFFGALPLAAHQVALQICSITFMVPFGVGQASTVLIGQAIGAGDRREARRAGWISIGFGLSFMSLMAVIMLIFREPLLNLFLSPDDPRSPAVLAIGVGFLAFGALFQIVDGLQVVGSCALRGLQDTRLPMVFAMIGFWGIGLTAAYVLAFPVGMGGNGIWLGQALGLAVVSILMVSRFHLLTKE